MARTNQPKNGKQGNNMHNGVRGARVQKQRKKHKIVLESNEDSNDKDKLRVVLSFHMEPPAGYTFIPAGNTQLTAAMKEFAKRGGYQIMAVSATPHAQRHELSREVHRVGYHFPTEVVSQVCTHYGIRLDSSGRLVGENDTEQLFMKISQKGQVVLNESVRDQVTINTEAKEIIRDLFPKIPDNDLFQIIKTAFQLGTNKVGTAEEIPLVRRAQLAVVAHIRHSYTDYDRLLRRLAYNDARHAVEEQTLQKLVEWRDTDKSGGEANQRNVDDAVKEVVVLSDEEESDSELEEGQVVENERVTVPAARRAERPAVATEHRPVSPAELSSGEEAPRGYRFLPQTVRRPETARLESDSHARLQVRYARLDQVRQQYHSAASTSRPAQIISRMPIDEPSIVHPIASTREVRYAPVPAVQYVAEQPRPTQTRVVRESSPPRLVRGADGRLYERVPRDEVEVLPRIPHTPSTIQPPSTYITSRRSASPRAQRPHQRVLSMNDNGTVLPSIERGDGYVLPSIRQNPFDPHPGTGLRAQRSNLIDLTSSAEQATKRMRLDDAARNSPRVAQIKARPDVVMVDDNDPPFRKPLVEIVDRSDELYRQRASHYQQSAYVRPGQEQGSHHQQPEALPIRRYEDLPQRRVVYENTPLQTEVHYVQAPYYESERPTRYIEESHPQVQRRPMVVEVLPREPMPNPFAPPMQGVRREIDPRYPQYPTTYARG